MKNRNTKYWFFTWDTNIKQKKLPSKIKLKIFLDQLADYAQFQEELGGKKKKLHYQGCLELHGPRVSKKKLLDNFQENFKNIGGLTLSKVFSKEAVLAYTSKQETKVSETIYCGRKEMFSEEIQELLTKEWQHDTFEFLKKVKYDDDFLDSQRFRKRSIYWLEDIKGGSGKSEFITWLRAGQRDLICRLLPMDSVDRLLHAVTEISKKDKVDVFLIDDTRTQGDKTSFNNMFEAIERIKNGHVVSTMYGHYAEVIYPRPQIIFFTNRDMMDYVKNLSRDRWYHMKIMEDNRLLKLGWTDDIFWDAIFDSPANSHDADESDDDKIRRIK